MIKYAAILACFTLPSIASEPVQLQYKFDVDEPTHFELTQEMSQTQTMQGQTMNTNSSTTSMMTTELLEAKEDGSILISTTTESMKLSITAPGTNLSYDSTLDADKSKLSNPTIASMASMVGMQVQLLIAPDGTILDVPNVDAIQQRIDAMSDPAVQQGASAMADKETIKATNEMNYKLLPDEPVEVGDQWSREFVVPLGFADLTTTLDLTLDSVKDGIASISISGAMTMPEVVQQGVTMNLSNSKVNGTLRFNIEDGVQEFLDLTNAMDMSASMENMPGPMFTMNISQYVKMTRADD